MFVFVTGVAGSGKSTLCARLSSRGFEAHDADDGISRHVRIHDGAEVASPPAGKQTPEWVSGHEFRFDITRVDALASRATPDQPVFLLGAAYGDEEVIAMADRSWFLHLDEADLRRRLAGRPAGSYGHQTHELESILAWHAAAADRYEGLGARRLDATRPVEQLVDDLIAEIAA